MPIRHSSGDSVHAAGYTNLKLSGEVWNGDKAWELMVNVHYHYYYILIPQQL